MKKTVQTWFSCAALCALCFCGVPAASAVDLTDVPDTHWAADAISWATEQGLFRQSDPAKFGLGQEVTRGEFVSALCKLYGWQMVTPETGSFEDNQDPSLWYYSAVETAFAHGAVTQQTETFRPYDDITREELAVMLVRSLGYGSIAGLTQSLPFPFQDVRTNLGYLSMAYQLGLIKGTSDTTFSPTSLATREQCAVILQRLSERLATPATMERIGVAASMDTLTDLNGYDAVGIAAARLTITSGRAQLSYPMGTQEFTLHDQVRSAGAKALLYVSGTEDVFSTSMTNLVSELSGAVTSRAYDGLMLDLSKLSAAKKSSMTQLVQSLDHALGEKPLYVVAEAPSWQGGISYGGYDYAALNEAADRLILRIVPYTKNADDFPTAPPEPLEELYYALSEVQSVLPEEHHLSVWMTTTGNQWKNGSQGSAVRSRTLDALLADPETSTHYSTRYACPYLTYQDGDAQAVVWYLDADALQARCKLLTFFGVDQLCFSDLTSVSQTLLGSN